MINKFNNKNISPKDVVGSFYMEEDKIDRKQNRDERLKYAHKSYYLVLRYIIGVLLLIAFAGLGFVDISDNIQLALIGSTLFQIIGLFKYVMEYLFNPSIVEKKR